MKRIKHGRIYKVEQGDFHSTLVERDNLTATLVLDEQVVSVSPRVLGDIDGQDVYLTERYRCSEGAVKSLIAGVTQKLSHQSSITS